MPLRIVNWYIILLPELEVTLYNILSMYLLEVLKRNKVKDMNKFIPGNDSSFKKDNSAEF